MKNIIDSMNITTQKIQNLKQWENDAINNKNEVENIYIEELITKM